MSEADEYLTLAAASTKLGWRGKPQARARRLLRVLRAKERLKSVELVIDVSEGPQRSHYRTTMRLLRRHCRELFVRGADELAKDFRRHLDRIREEVVDQVEMLVTSQLEELRAVDEEIISQLKDLREFVLRAEKPEPRKAV